MAREALDAIADAERDTYLPPRQPTAVALPKSVRLLVLLGGVFAIATAWWMFANADAWWGFPVGIAICLGFVLVVVRLEQRHTNVRPKLVMPRHVLWESIRAAWPMSLAIALLTPVALWFTSTERPFWLLLVAAVGYLATVLTIMLLLQQWRQREAAVADG